MCSGLIQSQTEITNLQQTNSEIKTEKATVSEQLSKTTEELVALRASSGGSTAKLEEMTRAWKDERARSKQLEQQIEALNDELKEARDANETAAQKADSLKKKLEKERERLEAEVEELKSRHEAETDDLRRKVAHEDLLYFD